MKANVALLGLALLTGCDGRTEVQNMFRQWLGRCDKVVAVELDSPVSGEQKFVATCPRKEAVK